MATISGTIRGATCMSRSFNGAGTREAWLIAADFGAYTGAADTAALAGIGAAIDAACRDGKVSTLRGGLCAYAARDTNNQAVYMQGAAVAALTVSSDDFTGNLTTAADVEVTTSTATSAAMGIIAFVDRA